MKVDNLYFLATGGGITFGGGEPLMNPKFLNEFRAACGKDWKINVETSLNVPKAYLQEVVDCVDSFIIDIKDMNPEIYSSYTGRDNACVHENLRYLSSIGLATVAPVLFTACDPDDNHNIEGDVCPPSEQLTGEPASSE